jgi:hypothetical protein
MSMAAVALATAAGGCVFLTNPEDYRLDAGQGPESKADSGPPPTYEFIFTPRSGALAAGGSTQSLLVNVTDGNGNGIGGVEVQVAPFLPDGGDSVSPGVQVTGIERGEATFMPSVAPYAGSHGFRVSAGSTTLSYQYNVGEVLASDRDVAALHLGPSSSDPSQSSLYWVNKPVGGKPEIREYSLATKSTATHTESADLEPLLAPSPDGLFYIVSDGLAPPAYSLKKLRRGAVESVATLGIARPTHLVAFPGYVFVATFGVQASLMRIRVIDGVVDSPCGLGGGQPIEDLVENGTTLYWAQLASGTDFRVFGCGVTDQSGGAINAPYADTPPCARTGARALMLGANQNRVYCADPASGRIRVFGLDLKSEDPAFSSPLPITLTSMLTVAGPVAFSTLTGVYQLDFANMANGPRPVATSIPEAGWGMVRSLVGGGPDYYVGTVDGQVVHFRAP